MSGHARAETPYDVYSVEELDPTAQPYDPSRPGPNPMKGRRTWEDWHRPALERQE